MKYNLNKNGRTWSPRCYHGKDAPMIAETSRRDELKSHWPYLLVLSPLSAVDGLITLVMVVAIQAQRRRLEEEGLIRYRVMRGPDLGE